MCSRRQAGPPTPTPARPTSAALSASSASTSCPGCTGWAQVHGLRGDTDIAERIRYDIWYIENWTVALDIKIIFRTVFGGKMVNDEKLQ